MTLKGGVWAVAIAIFVAVGIIAANEYRIGKKNAREVAPIAVPTSAVAAPEVNVPAVPTKAEVTPPPTTVPVAPQNGQNTASINAPPGTTVNVIVNCCPPQPCSAPKAVVKKPKAKKLTKRQTAKAVASPPVAAAISRYEKTAAGPCVDCPPTSRVLTGASRFEAAPCVNCR